MLIHDKEERYVIQMDKTNDGKEWWVTLQSMQGQHLLMDVDELKDLALLIQEALEYANGN